VSTATHRGGTLVDGQSPEPRCPTPVASQSVPLWISRTLAVLFWVLLGVCAGLSLVAALRHVGNDLRHPAPVVVYFPEVSP
jgi:hypothetical protein